MKKWLELIGEKEDQILAEGEKAYKEALNNTHLRFIVEMDEEGDVYSWCDIAGGNSYHRSVHEGKAIELFEFCFQYYEIEISDDTLESKLIEKGYKEELEELKVYAEENGTSVEVEIINGDNNNLKDVIEECRNEEIEFLISEYAHAESESKLDYLKNCLKSYEY